MMFLFSFTAEANDMNQKTDTLPDTLQALICQNQEQYDQAERENKPKEEILALFKELKELRYRATLDTEWYTSR